MKVPAAASLAVLALATSAFGIHRAHAARPAPVDVCALYGFAPHTRAHAQCRLNLRHYWSTGPCTDWEFAAVHPRYCHLIPELDF